MMQPLFHAPLLRRSLFLLGNLAPGLVIVLAVVVPVKELLAERDREILQQRAILSRLQAVAAREVSTPAVHKAGAGADEYLTGKTDGIIAAELQTRLKGMVETSGGRLRSVRSLQPRTDAQTKYIGSHIEMVGAIAAIHRAVQAIESAKPYLFVTGGTIRLAAPTGQVGAPQEPVIEAQLDVFGAVRIEAGEP
jgi:hypothetical protein